MGGYITAVRIHHGDNISACQSKSRFPCCSRTAIEKEVLMRRIQFRTWPPARVYIDGEFVVEAQSPVNFSVVVGQHKIKIVPEAGTARIFSVTLGRGIAYMLELNLDWEKFKLKELRL